MPELNLTLPYSPGDEVWSDYINGAYVEKATRFFVSSITIYRRLSGNDKIEYILSNPDGGGDRLRRPDRVFPTREEAEEWIKDKEGKEK